MQYVEETKYVPIKLYFALCHSLFEMLCIYCTFFLYKYQGEPECKYSTQLIPKHFLYDKLLVYIVF